MRVAIDTSPISKKINSLHSVRGVGSYINMLVENLPRIDKKNEYVFVEDKKFPEDIDLIHYPYFDPFFITLPFLPKKKFIVTVHDLIPLVFPKHFPPGLKGNLKWITQRQLLKNASAIVTDSECSRKDIERIVGVKGGHVKVVYLAAEKSFKPITDTPALHSASVKYKLPENFILYVGDVTWNKNLPRLIDAIKKTPYPLVLVGKVWDQKPSEISQNPWNKDFKFVMSAIEEDKQFIRLGFVSGEDLVRIYNMATVLVMPSLYEGFGLPVLEAISCGCPVITSKEGSLHEVGGNACYFIDPYSLESIKKGIMEIMRNEELRIALSKKGLEQAKRFSLEKTIGGLVKVYENC